MKQNIDRQSLVDEIIQTIGKANPYTEQALAKSLSARASVLWEEYKTIEKDTAEKISVLNNTLGLQLDYSIKINPRFTQDWCLDVTFDTFMISTVRQPVN
jgi:hypothetical protein